jgi:hypothetical protein
MDYHKNVGLAVRNREQMAWMVAERGCTQKVARQVDARSSCPGNYALFLRSASSICLRS